jgi:uncharacterized protein (DUF4415 family)
MRGEIARLISRGRPTAANGGNTMKRYRLDPKKLRQLTEDEARRLDAARIDYSDVLPFDEEFFAKAKQAWPPTKQQLTIRLDTDVVRWLKAHGRGYQSRNNRILRAAMESTKDLDRDAAPRAPKKTRGPSR